MNTYSRCLLERGVKLVCECEMVRPGPRKIGPKSWRLIPIHPMIQPAGDHAFLNQPFCQGDPPNRSDDFIKDSWIIGVQEAKPLAAEDR
jgi:hypothetical protein